MAKNSTATAPKNAIGKGKGKAAGSDKKNKPAKVKPPKVNTFTVKAGKAAGTGVSKEGVDGVTRTRFSWNGCSLSSLLKLIGYLGGTLDHCRTMLAAFQLDGVTSGSTVSCQHSAGAQLAAGVTPHHGGAVAELDKSQLAAFKKLCGM